MAFPILCNLVLILNPYTTSLQKPKKNSTPETPYLVNDVGLDIPEVEPSLKGRIAYENNPQRCYEVARVRVPSYNEATKLTQKLRLRLQIRFWGDVRLERQLL